MQQLTAPRSSNLFGMVDAHKPWQFDGQWRVVLCLRGGQEGTWCEYLELHGNTFSATHDLPATGRIVLRHNLGQPAEIDLVYSMESGLHSGDRIEGIYRLVGEQVLIMNLGLDAEGEAHYPRPTSFAPTKVSTLLVLMNFERNTTPAVDSTASAHAPGSGTPDRVTTLLNVVQPEFVSSKFTAPELLPV